MTTPALPRVEMTLAHIFLDHAEFRHRSEPLDFDPSAERKPSPPAAVTVNLRLAEDKKSVAVRLQVESENPDNPYIYSVAYVALFTVQTDADLDAEESKPIRDRMMATGATVAMPFARELVGNLTGRSRLGPQWLNPINFATHLLNPESQNKLVPPTI